MSSDERTVKRRKRGWRRIQLKSGLDVGRGLGVRSADANIREFTAGSSVHADVGIRAPQLRQPKIREPERGCVVLDQPQRVARSRALRLVFDADVFTVRRQM